MPFDAGMLCCAVAEIREKVLGARVEKVYVPERDVLILQMRSPEGTKRIRLQAGCGTSRISFTGVSYENPQNPPMFCMLLRKHLSGSVLTAAEPLGFDRIAVLRFAGRDEMGFPTERRLVAELMGRYSNIFFCDGDGKILSALNTESLSIDSPRGLIAGGKYDSPGSDRLDPRSVTEQAFCSALGGEEPSAPCAKALLRRLAGFSPSLSAEIIRRAGYGENVTVGETDAKVLYSAVRSVFLAFEENGTFAPTMLRKDGKPFDCLFYEPLPKEGIEAVRYASCGAMFDDFYAEKDRENRVSAFGSDLVRVLSNAEARLQKKKALHEESLRDAEHADEYKKAGDLLTANLWQIERGQSEVLLDDWEALDEEGNPKKVSVKTDTRLTPAQNAQNYYRKYAKAKRTAEHMKEQLRLGEEEEKYLASVRAMLSLAETPTDLREIREELAQNGYAGKVAKGKTAGIRRQKITPLTFHTASGKTILCGKNNTQNEYITHRLAEKNDMWFHAKGIPGAHVLLVLHGETPTDEELTEAAEIAARYSSAPASADAVEVDYTPARYVKKPNGGKPGFVIYHTNRSAVIKRK